jgi:hypothetical protein
MVELMRLCPPTAAFFLNAWTWGYEDMLKAAASAFGCKVRPPFPSPAHAPTTC